MNPQFSDRIKVVKKSFIREIFKYLDVEGMISFSGGFPNPESFPIQAISDATQKVLAEDGKKILQYSGTEGYLPLRQWISERYLKRFDLKIDPSEILIVNGSQQALDLIGKCFLNKGDHILMEKPAYLGAIQSLSMFEPVFHHATLTEKGLDIEEVKDVLSSAPIKLLYTVPNFQNPSGITYSLESRKALAQSLEGSDVVLIEDDPYGELRFLGDHIDPIKKFAYDRTIMLGSFSKIVSPGLRLGWVVAPKAIMERLIVAKQASDLHSNVLSQYAVHRFLMDNDIDAHIAKIKSMYQSQREAMVLALEEFMPEGIEFTKPEGGMFLWVTLPKALTSMGLFERAAAAKVVFVPGDPFYTEGENHPTMRLNYTNSKPEEIRIGIERLARCIKEELAAQRLK